VDAVENAFHVGDAPFEPPPVVDPLPHRPGLLLCEADSDRMSRCWTVPRQNQPMSANASFNVLSSCSSRMVIGPSWAGD